MAWRFRKTFKTGPIQTTVTKQGISNSIGFLGFRVGITADNKKIL